MKPFPTSAACCFGILFISVSLKTTGSSEVVGSADPVVALAGDDVILPCSLKPRVSAEDMLVKWTGLFLETRNVHLYLDGRDSNEEQHPFYSGRTSMFHDELKNGNVSLKLTRVTLSDAGSYQCFIPTLTSQVKETTIQLFVGAVSQPVISIDGTKGWGVVLKCESGGWYPEPEMVWLDSSGTILPADGPPERHWDKEGLCTVRQHVTVDRTDTNRFTCIVQQLKINHKKETEIHVPDLTFPKSQLILGLLITAAVGVLAACIGVYMWRKHKELKFKKSEVMRDAQFVNINRFYLIQNVTMVIPIAFYLIRSEKYSEIHAARTRQDQMELLYEALDSGGKKLRSDFYRILLDLEPDAVISCGAKFVDDHKDYLIQEVTLVKPIIYELFYELYCNTRTSKMNTQDQMRQLYQALEEAEDTRRVKSDFYRILLDLEPKIVNDLDPFRKQKAEFRRRNAFSMQSDVLFPTLSRRLDEAITERDELKDELTEFRKQNAEFRKQNDQLIRQKDQLIRQKVQKRRWTAPFRKQNDQFRRERDEAITERDELKEQLTLVIKQNDQLIRQKAQFRRERDEAITERDELKEELKGMEMKPLLGPGMEMKPLLGPEMEMKPLLGPGMEMKPLLGPGPQKDDLDEMERGGRITTEVNYSCSVDFN